MELIHDAQIRNVRLGMFEQKRTKDDELVKGSRSRVEEAKLVEGPGLQGTLSDSARRQSPTDDPNDLVVHEQGLQAVGNALWTGGAAGTAQASGMSRRAVNGA